MSEAKCLRKLANELGTRAENAMSTGAADYLKRAQADVEMAAAYSTRSKIDWRTGAPSGMTKER